MFSSIYLSYRVPISAHLLIKLNLRSTVRVPFESKINRRHYKLKNRQMSHTSASLLSRIWIRFASCLICSSFLKRLVCLMTAEMLASSNAFSSFSDPFRRDFLNPPETPATKNRPARCCANLSFFGYLITVESKKGKSVI